MNRRGFIRTALLGAPLSGLLSVAGCGDEAKQTGTTVETTPEDIKGFEAAEQSYRAMETKGAVPKK